MKLNKYTSVLLAALAFAACEQMDEAVPQGGTVLSSQLQEVIEKVPSRTDAQFNGMFTKLGEPLSVFGSQGRADDWGFIMMQFSNDAESADLVIPNSGYNWFSVCGEYTSRNADYANPYIRYAAAYNQISAANDIIKMYPADTEDPAALQKIAQAKAIRAFSYLNLAPYFQFRYETHADQPCVPIVTEETTDFTNNPRATVAKVYELILEDLNYAIEKLAGFTRPSKMYIDKQTAHGLRARAYLNMGKYAEAAQDADSAMVGYTPASIEEVSTPSFYSIDEHNWIWGYDMTTDMASTFQFGTSSSWVRSFSNNGYAAACQVYSCINNLLYDKIPATDVRKGWWVDENLYSPLLDGLIWDGVEGQAIATYTSVDKLEFIPYTNVKFGMYEIGGSNNDEDWPWMRVEEMILIKAEAVGRTDEAAGRAILEDFVKTYRDPAYSSIASGRSFVDEVWFQRRIELWGEGFTNNDTRRLGKPLVRFHADKKSNWPEAFRFNMTADDGWWLMRFCTSETNTNLAIVDNTGGAMPVQDQNGELRDGVTD